MKTSDSQDLELQVPDSVRRNLVPGGAREGGEPSPVTKKPSSLLKYKTVEALSKKIDEYFTKGVNKRRVILGSGKDAEVKEIPIPTITGLVYYLGFVSRQSFYELEVHPVFGDTVKRARLKIEQEYEEALRSGCQVAGPIFALKNMGWFDRQEITGKDGQAFTVPQIVVSSPEGRDATEKVINGQRTTLVVSSKN